MKSKPLTKEQCENWRNLFPHLKHLTNFEINLIRDDLNESERAFEAQQELLRTHVIHTDNKPFNPTIGDFFPV